MASLLTSALSTGASAAHAAAASLLSAAQITIGADLPTITASKTVKAAGAPQDGISLGERVRSGRVVIVGVPGAFTPSCSSQAPGYIAKAEAFAEKGVTGIYIVSVNDAFVVQAWKEKLTEGKETPVHFIADDKGEFTASLGLLFDATPFLGAPRSKRYVLVAEAGKVTHLAVENAPPDVTVTKADTILAQL